MDRSNTQSVKQYGIPRRERMMHRQDYLNAYKTGDKRVGHAFVCYLVQKENTGRKLGCTVSKRVGKAVVRNRVKRYIREFYRLHRHMIPDNAAFIVVARPKSAELNYHACKGALSELLRRRGNQEWPG